MILLGRYSYQILVVPVHNLNTRQRVNQVKPKALGARMTYHSG